MEIEEKTLVEQFRDGSHQAFGVLYTRYYDLLQQFSVKKLHLDS